MLRAVLLPLFLFSAIEFFGQAESAEFYHHVCSLPDSSIQIVYEALPNSHWRYIIFETENGKDQKKQDR